VSCLTAASVSKKGLLDGREGGGGEGLCLVPWDMQVLSGARLQQILVYQLRQEEVSALNDSLHKAPVCAT
jgi:hypothetical protein